MDAGAQAGVLQKQEHHFIENVFELENVTVPSSMTTRENVVYFTLKENETVFGKTGGISLFQNSLSVMNTLIR